MSMSFEAGELESLAWRMAAGEEVAFAEFGRRFGPRLWAFFHRLGLSPADAEEMAVTSVTEVSLRILQYTPSLDGRFTGWVYTVAYRLMVDWKRRNRRHEASLSDAVTSQLPAIQLDDDRKATSAEQAMIVGAVQDAMEELPEVDRQIVSMRHLGIEHSYEEIAHKLGISSGNARVRHHRALRKLEQLLAQNPRLRETVTERCVEVNSKEERRVV